MARKHYSGLSTRDVAGRRSAARRTRERLAREGVRYKGKVLYGAAAMSVLKEIRPWYESARPKRKVKKSCRRPGEYKPGGGRYEKKTCLPRRKPKRKCHRAGQFKPGGGRYVTTPCRRKTKKRKRSARGSAESMSIF